MGRSCLIEIHYLGIMTDLDIYKKLVTLPDDMKKEVDQFIDFLKSKALAQRDTNIQARRKAGLAKGLIQMGDDFDDPLEDFKEYME